MKQLGQPIWLGIEKVKTAALRFPFMSLSSFLAFVFIIIYHHYSDYFSIPQRYWFFMMLEAIGGIAIFFSFMIFAERNKLDVGKRIGFGLLGFCILGLHFFSLPDWAASIDSTYFLRFLLLIITFICLASFIVFNREGEQMAFWQYNQYLFITFIVASAYSLVLFLGIAGAVFAVENLFDLIISNDVYLDILVFFGIFINTLFFSSVMPRDLSDFEKKENYKDALRKFVQYVLVPILGIYLIILLFYFGKMLIASTFPKGLVCIPILIFSILSILCYLLAYPIRMQAGNGLIQFFSKNIFYFLLPLLVIYFIGLSARLIPYGLTEWRYMGILLGIWLALVSLFTIFDQRETLIFFPVSLFLLLILGTVGPWGMFQMSARSQNNRLKRLLTHEQLLVNKVLDVQAVQAKLSDSLQNEVSSITKFLFYREKIELVYPILAEDEKKQIDAIQKGTNKVAAFNTFLEKTFRLKDDQLLTSELQINASVSDTVLFDIESYNSMRQYQVSNKTENVKFALADSMLYLTDSSFFISLQPILDTILYNTNIIESEDVASYKNDFEPEKGVLYSEDKMKKIYIKDISFTMSEDSIYNIKKASIIYLEK